MLAHPGGFSLRVGDLAVATRGIVNLKRSFMYTLAAHNPKAVLGYDLWCGFENNARQFRLREISVTSFTQFHMFTYLMVIPTMEFALAEAARLNQILKDDGHAVELFVLPLSVLQHQMKFWSEYK